MEDTVIRRIEWGSEEYREELVLRNRVLRIPLGMDLFQEDLGQEEADIHIGAFLSGRLTGVLLLKPVDGTCVKMRQVAVLPEQQARGLGRRMVAYAEDIAREKGYQSMILHARKSAAGFYTKLGYSIVGAEFTEVGIPHVAMRKRLEDK